MPPRLPRRRSVALAVLAAAAGLLLAFGPAVSASPRTPLKPTAGDLHPALEQPARWVARRALIALGEEPRPTRRRRAPERPRLPIAGAYDLGEAGARYGAMRSGHVHEGQDMFAPAGTPLVAVRDAVVVETGNDGGRGNYIALFSRAAGQTYNYLHMQAPATLAVGARVKAGAVVGRVGCTGSCFGDHLHFEIRSGRGANGASADPLPSLQRWAARRR